MSSSAARGGRRRAVAVCRACRRCAVRDCRAADCRERHDRAARFRQNAARRGEQKGHRERRVAVAAIRYG